MMWTHRRTHSEGAGKILMVKDANDNKKLANIDGKHDTLPKSLSGKNTLVKRLFRKKALEKQKSSASISSESLWMTTVRPRILVTEPSNEGQEDSKSAGKSKFYSTTDISIASSPIISPPNTAPTDISHLVTPEPQTNASLLDDIYEEQDSTATSASASAMFTRSRKVRASTGSMNTKTSLKCASCGYAIKPRERVRLPNVDACYHRACLKCYRCEVALTSQNASNLTGKTMGDQLVCNDHSDAKEEKCEDFFDLIANFQRGRIEDQRCELRPRITKSASIPHLDIKPAIVTDDAKIDEILGHPAPYPMVVEPLAGGYRCEGFVTASDLEYDENKLVADLDPKQIVFSQDSHINVYQELFFGKEHINYVGEYGEQGQIVMSVAAFPEQPSEYLVILRTNTTSYTKQVCQPEDDYSVLNVAKEVCNGELQAMKFQPVAFPGAAKHINAFDERFVKSDFKFGIIYQKYGQVKEECLFGNQHGSPALDNFLNLMGDKVELEGFQGFRGGLDTNKGQTGTHSVYTEYHGRELMFHVSTLLPYSEGDNQQLQRKRHIGNDIVTIVFQEENTPFLPNSIASHFLHVYIIVQPLDPTSKDTKYKVSTACRGDVPDFEPALPKPAIFTADELFRDFLLTKLINAELAAHQAIRFAEKMTRTRKHYMKELHDMLMKKNEESLTFHPAIEKSMSSGMIDSFRKFANRKASSSSTCAVAADGKRQSGQVDVCRSTPTAERKKKPFWRPSNSAEKSRSWERNTTAVVRTPSGDSSSLNAFRGPRSSQNSLKAEENNSSSSSSPKDKRVRANGRSTPSSTYSDEDLFRYANEDSDTGVGSMSPADTTPNSTLEMRLHQSKSSSDHKSLYAEDGDTSKSLSEVQKKSTSFKNDYIAAKNDLNEMDRKLLKTTNDLMEAKKENKRLLEEIEKLLLNEKDYRNKVQSLLSSMSKEEMV